MYPSFFKYSNFKDVINDEDSCLNFILFDFHFGNVESFTFLFLRFLNILPSAQFDPHISFEFNWGA